ncbi:hypothetical protein C8F01DRAFT_1260919 [Mycena amicta]|nr:hypothetical protein C8F01DRAFT_1260919 [Mycena amicta]
MPARPSTRTPEEREESQRSYRTKYEQSSHGKDIRSKYRKKTRGRKQPPPNLHGALQISEQILQDALVTLPIDDPLFQRTLRGTVDVDDMYPYVFPPPYRIRDFDRDVYAPSRPYNTVDELKSLILGHLSKAERDAEKEARAQLALSGRLEMQKVWTRDVSELVAQWKAAGDQVLEMDGAGMDRYLNAVGEDKYIKGMGVLHRQWLARRVCRLRGLEFLKA